METLMETHDKIKDANCTKYKNKSTGKIDIERWFSTSDEKLIRDAILLLTQTDIGFEININAPSFKENNGGNAELTIQRTGYGVGIYGPVDEWTVFGCYWKPNVENMLETFKNPEEAVDRFLSMRKEMQIGYDMAEFTASGCPNWKDE